MAKPIFKDGAERIPLQLGMFPGIIAQRRNEQAPRLKATITITCIDRYTEEKFQRVIPLETDEPEDLIEWLTLALQHARVQADVMSFIEKREG